MTCRLKPYSMLVQPEKGLYTLVLLVPQGNPPLLTYALEPTGQRIRLDSNALMTSTSMEGLDLKQFEITNVRDSIDVSISSPP